MDLRIYYQRIRDFERSIEDEFPIIVSTETADGGKAGTKTEVTRRIAAKLVMDGIARLATPEEVAAYRAAVDAARRAAAELASASRMQLTVMTTADVEKLKGKSKAEE